ncbi:methionyl-tRNA formyltransferase [Hansschlegelia plantiphila]|uniref:Methionyl-tRNA formyltransferase n=1 Tax=Hansschlegelia plantiphila TaxID=374655 RepID=A0A9W6J412_9HYPH|nr:methionyl-tRNA formyltransferase [Hansschlegelia plantiphila]GLK68840.1 methionyl-tRNA formyltransferase [Hansschlegelia plantiphila]
MSLRLVFMGTPDFAVPTLSELVGQGHEIAAVYTRAPKPAGRRGMELTKTPVHRLAEGLNLPVYTPRTFRDEETLEAFAAHEADAAVVVAYGLILPKAALDAPELGCLNLHASLLPRWRGAAPIQRAIMAGDPETGVMAMKMEEGLDTGPIGMAERVTIGPDETAGELQDRLSLLGADLMARAVSALGRGGLTFRPQAADGVAYAAKIAKSEARIDWSAPGAEVHDRIRGLSPFPGAWFELEGSRGPERVKVLRSTRADGAGTPGELLDSRLTIACGDGAVRLLQLQRAGKEPVEATAFLHGARLAPGARLG